MDGDPYNQQQHFARSQNMPSASSSTLNHLLSTPASYAPQMSQPPYYQQPFDPRNQIPMYAGPGRTDMGFVQNPGMPDRNAGPGLTDWSQQPPQPNPFQMFSSGANVQQQQQAPSFGEPPSAPPKKKKRNRSKEKSNASSAQRSSAVQLQQQVQQQMQMQQPGPQDPHQSSRNKAPAPVENFGPMGMVMRQENPTDQFFGSQQKFLPRPGMQQLARAFGLPNSGMTGSTFAGQVYNPPRPSGMPSDLPGQGQFPGGPGNDPGRMYFQQPSMGSVGQPSQSPFSAISEPSWPPSADNQQFDDKTMSSAASVGARSPFSTQNSEASFGESAPVHSKSTPSRPAKSKQSAPPATPQSHSSMGDMDGDSNSSWSKPSASEPMMHTPSTKPNEKLNLLYEMGDEPDRRGFIEHLIRFCEEIGSPIINIPIISKVPLDLFKFYKVIQARGGYVEVQKSKGWKDIAGALGILAPNPNTAYTLRKQYMKFILPYEARFDRGGVDAETLIQTADAAIVKSPSRSSSGSSRKRSRSTVNAVQELSVEGFDGAPQAPPQLPQHLSFQNQLGPNEPHMGHQFPQEMMQQQHQYPPGASPGDMTQMPPQPPGFWSGQGMPLRPPNDGGRGPPFDNYQDVNRFPPPARNVEEPLLQRHSAPRPMSFPSGPTYQQHPQQGNVFPFNGERHPMGNEPNVPVEMASERRVANGSAHADPSRPPDRHALLPSNTYPGAEGPTHNLRTNLTVPGGRLGHIPQPHVLSMGNTSHCISFPPNSVEATDPVMKPHRKLNIRDINLWTSELDLWKLHMRLRSGLLAESAWAIEVINIFSSDEAQCHHLKLMNAPAGFLDTILDWFGVTMRRLLNISTKLAKEEDDMKCNGHGPVKEEPLNPSFFANSEHYRTSFLAQGDFEQEFPEDNLDTKAQLEAVDVNIPEAPHLNLKSEGDAELSRRCLSISTCIRNLSAINGNETILAKNQRLLYLLGRFITFNHYHIPAPVVAVVAIEPEEELLLLKNYTPPNAFWIQEQLEHVRENLMVTLANISGYTDLAESEEAVCRPILEGLIHWTICSSSSAQDTLSTVLTPHSVGELSARSLSMETLSKLTVNETNVDLLIATLSGDDLPLFIHQLIQLIPNSASSAAAAINYLTREYALVILCSLVSCDERVSQIVAEHQFGIEYLTMLLEESDRSAKIIAGTGKLMQMGGGIDGFELHGAGSTVNSLMLKKAIEILCSIAEPASQRGALKRWQRRFWDLVIDSRFADPVIISGLTRILFLLGSANEEPVAQC